MPGSGSAATSTPVELVERPKSSRMSGIAGDMSELPMMLVSVIAKISGTRRRCSLVNVLIGSHVRQSTVAGSLPSVPCSPT